MEFVDVLIDRASGTLSILATDDTSRVEVEHTITVQEAWKLVTELNHSIQKLSSPPTKPKPQRTYHPNRKYRKKKTV